jgi:hypothetical protein
MLTSDRPRSPCLVSGPASEPLTWGSAADVLAHRAELAGQVSTTWSCVARAGAGTGVRQARLLVAARFGATDCWTTRRSVAADLAWWVSMIADGARLPTRLLAATPGWTLHADVIVVGSGIAGLATAIHARRAGHRVLVVTKANISAGSTQWAQGGIAAALAEDDSPGEHLRDTLVAGAGLCDAAAVDILVTEGPAAIRNLVAWVPSLIGRWPGTRAHPRGRALA